MNFPKAEKSVSSQTTELSRLGGLRLFFQIFLLTSSLLAASPGQKQVVVFFFFALPKALKVRKSVGEGREEAREGVLDVPQKSTSSLVIRLSTTSLWYRMSLSAVMASRSGALISVGPNTMPRFSLDIRFSFSFWVTLGKAKPQNKGVKATEALLSEDLVKRRWRRPLEVSHEVAQRLQVGWRQQLQGLVQGLQPLLRVTDLCTRVRVGVGSRAARQAKCF